MAKNQLPRQTKDKEDKRDVEYYKGIIRQQKKIIAQLQKENVRLTKHIDSRYQMIDDYMTGFDLPVIHDEFSGWRCQKCKHHEYDELVLGQGGSKTKEYRTCKKCGHKERMEYDTGEQGNASLDTRRK